MNRIRGKTTQENEDYMLRRPVNIVIQKTLQCFMSVKKKD